MWHWYSGKNNVKIFYPVVWVTSTVKLHPYYKTFTKTSWRTEEFYRSMFESLEEHTPTWVLTQADQNRSKATVVIATLEFSPPIVHWTQCEWHTSWTLSCFPHTPTDTNTLSCYLTSIPLWVSWCPHGNLYLHHLTAEESRPQFSSSCGFWMHTHNSPDEWLRETWLEQGQTAKKEGGGE